jgi:xylose isomerase
MRTQKGKGVTAHLTGSRQIFLHVLAKVRSWDRKLEQQYIDARDYEALELAVMKHLMGVK